MPLRRRLWCRSPSLCFFFSSRRRHTRCLSDWSSDVCSSDLFARGWFDPRRKRPLPRFPGRVAVITSPTGARSEERSVGKECRAVVGGNPGKKNMTDTRNDKENKLMNEIEDDTRVRQSQAERR